MLSIKILASGLALLAVCGARAATLRVHVVDQAGAPL
jgi:hypothetical protein